MSKLKSKLIIIQCAALTISLASVFAGVYAWYTSNRQATITATNITAEKGVSINAIKEYNRNGSLGYQTGDVASVEYSSSTFTSITSDMISIGGICPTYRFTYAIEFTNGFTAHKNIELLLSSFISSPSANYYLDGETKVYIKLAQAINIYGTSFNLSDSGNQDISDFINGTSLTDTFDFSYSWTPSDEATYTYSDNQSIITSIAATSSTQVALFTIEFSNDSSTFYLETSTADCYSASTSGNSNAYASLENSFSLTDLILKPIDA